MHTPEIETTEEVQLPRGFSIQSSADGLLITRLWRSEGAISVVLLAVVFNVVWISNDFIGVVLGERALLLKMFALFFILLGLGFSYLMVAIWLNKTTISVSRSTIEIKARPIPWRGNRIVQTSNVHQIYVKRKFRGSSNNNPRYSYDVLGLTNQDKPIKILTGCAHQNQAKYIEQELEKALGIDNVAVEDEI